MRGKIERRLGSTSRSTRTRVYLRFDGHFRNRELMCIKESPLERGIHEAGIHCTLLCALAFRPLQPQNESLLLI